MPWPLVIRLVETLIPLDFRLLDETSLKQTLRLKGCPGVGAPELGSQGYQRTHEKVRNTAAND